METKGYDLAMEYLEDVSTINGIASINFNDGQMVMITLDLLRKLTKQVEDSGTGRAIIFIGRGGELK